MAGIPGMPSGTKPTDVNAPVPQTAGDPFADGPQAAAAGKAAASIPAAQAGAPAAPADPFAAGPDAVAPAPDEQPAQPGMGMQALDAAGRVLDYPGGFARAGLASVAGLATGQGEIVTAKDLADAAKGKGPNSAEYLRRLGVSEGGSMNLPGLGRVTMRGAEGLAIDVLTDPLTLIAKTAKSIPYIQKMLDVPGKISEALGEAVYKSAITSKNGEKAATAGAALIEAGAPVGGQAALNAKIADAASTMGKVRQGLYDKFAEAGGKVDMPADAFKNAEGVLKGLRENPTKQFQGLADEFQAMLDSYKGQGFVNMDQMSKWKTQLYDSLPKGAFNGVKLTNPGKMFKSALANDFKNLIVDSGNKVEQGLGDAINTVNDKWGALLESSAIAGPKVGGSLGHMIDGAVIGIGGIPALLKKKAFETAIGPYGRTVTGNALMAAGKNDLANRLARQALVKPGQPDAVPDEQP